MSDVVPYAVAVRAAAEVLVKALVIRDFLPARLAARRAHVPGGPAVEELEALIIERRDISIAARMCMARNDHGFFAQTSGRASVADSIDRAAEQILHERALSLASASGSETTARGTRTITAQEIPEAINQWTSRFPSSPS